MNFKEKPIIKPKEFADLKDIVLLAHYRFSRIDKMPYYENINFKKLV